MDPLARTQLQTDIAKFKETCRKDPAVSMVLQAAIDALTARDWQKAKEKFLEAQASFSPDVKVVDILVGTGKAVSRAQARRQIQGGVVKVDGVQLRHPDLAVKADQQVTFKGESLRE